MKKIYIAGAHSRAQTLKEYLTYLYPETEVISYLVDDMLGNPPSVGVIPVNLIKEGLHVEYPVYLGTRSVNHFALTVKLQEVGFTRIIPVTVELDIRLRNAYVSKLYQEKGKSFCLIDNL